MAKQISAEELLILREAFDAYDADKGGSITVEEFAKAMSATGHTATEAEVQQIINEVDLDGDGTINFDEFVVMMTGGPKPPQPASAPAEIDPEADFKSAWTKFDPSLNGSISASQFRQVMAGLGDTVTDAEVDELVNSVDGEDKISYKEFLQFVKSKESVDERQ